MLLEEFDGDCAPSLTPSPSYSVQMCSVASSAFTSIHLTDSESLVAFCKLPVGFLIKATQV